MAGSLLTVVEFSDEKIVLDWLSDDSTGALTAEVISTHKAALALAATNYLIVPDGVKGFVAGLEAVPGENGDLATDVPAALYDITLTDVYGSDVACGELANLSGSTATKITSTDLVAICSEITINVTNAGNAKQGRLIIFLKSGE